MPQDRNVIRAALDRAIASGKPVTLVMTLESGSKREVRGVITGWFKGHDGRDRIGLLVGMQTQQAVLADMVSQVLDE